MLIKMYKILIILCMFTICGCTKNITLNINNSKVTNIIYDKINIPSNNFDEVLSFFNNKKLFDLYDISVEGKELIINTSDDTYNFKVLDNYIIYLDGNKNYYVRIDNLNMCLNNIIKNE